MGRIRNSLRALLPRRRLPPLTPSQRQRTAATKAKRRREWLKNGKYWLQKNAGKYIGIICLLLVLLLFEAIAERGDLQLCGAAHWEPLGAAEQVQPGELQVHCIDVGQGSCTLLRSSEAAVLIDAGGSVSESLPTDYLHRLGISKLDWVICTHLHADHINAMDEVVRSVTIDNIVLGEVPPGLEPDSDAAPLHEAIEGSGAVPRRVQQGDVLRAGDMRIAVLAPLPPSQAQPVTDLNDSSVVLRIECGGTGVFIGGDITKTVEQQLLQAGAIQPCAVYVASHHGSSLSSCEQLLDALQPEYCCISCGKHNDYNHPGDALLRRLEQRGIETLRTDRTGTIVLSFSPEEQQATPLQGAAA